MPTGVRRHVLLLTTGSVEVRLDALLVQLENRLDLMARRDLAQRLPLVN